VTCRKTPHLRDRFVETANRTDSALPHPTNFNSPTLICNNSSMAAVTTPPLAFSPTERSFCQIVQQPINSPIKPQTSCALSVRISEIRADGILCTGGAAGVAQAQGAPRTALVLGWAVFASVGTLPRDPSVVFYCLSQRRAHDGMVVREEGRILDLGNTSFVGLDQRERHRSRNRRCTSPEGDRQARRDLWIVVKIQPLRGAKSTKLSLAPS
jgi:hypothetical protein